MILELACLAIPLLGVPSAEACELRAYDKAAPAAYANTVERPDLQLRFRWSSDVDTVGDRHQIWNYIANKHDTSEQIAKWPKAGIQHPPRRPLPPGGILCNSYFVPAYDVDYDAPITYTNQGDSQRATAYVPPDREASIETPALGTREAPTARPAGSPFIVAGEARLSSVVETSYLDEARRVRSVRVEVIATRIGEGVRMQIVAQPRDLIVGLSILPSAVSTAQFARISEPLVGTGAKIDVAKASDFAPGYVELLGGEPEDRFAFFTGLDGRPFVIEANTVAQRTGRILVLDQRRRPVVQAVASLLVPAR